MEHSNTLRIKSTNHNTASIELRSASLRQRAYKCTPKGAQHTAIIRVNAIIVHSNTPFGPIEYGIRSIDNGAYFQRKDWSSSTFVDIPRVSDGIPVHECAVSVFSKVPSYALHLYAMHARRRRQETDEHLPIRTVPSNATHNNR